MKQDSRIDVAAIKAHPWFNKPLPPKYDASLKELAREQAVIDEKVQQGAFHNAERDKALEVRTAAAAACVTVCSLACREWVVPPGHLLACLALACRLCGHLRQVGPQNAAPPDDTLQPLRPTRRPCWTARPATRCPPRRCSA